MNRCSFMGALTGKVAAAAGFRSFTRSPTLASARHVTMLMGSTPGKTETALDVVPSDALALPGVAPWRTAPAPRAAPAPSAEAERPAAVPARPEASHQAPPTAPADLPVLWPGASGEITATASLPPLAQLERLIDLFGRSGDAAPSFAAALIGELVLTRMRLAACDPRTLFTLRAELP